MERQRVVDPICATITVLDLRFNVSAKPSAQNPQNPTRGIFCALRGLKPVYTRLYELYTFSWRHFQCPNYCEFFSFSCVPFYFISLNKAVSESDRHWRWACDIAAQFSTLRHYFAVRNETFPQEIVAVCATLTIVLRKSRELFSSIE